MTESLVFEHECKKETLLGEFVLTGASSHGIIKIDCPAYQGAIRRNRPHLGRRSLTFFHPIHHIRMVNDEPEKGPFARFLREPIYIVAWDYRGKGATGFQLMNCPLCSKVPPTVQSILPDYVGIFGMTTPLSPIPVVIKGIDPRL